MLMRAQMIRAKAQSALGAVAEIHVGIGGFSFAAGLAEVKGKLPSEGGRSACGRGRLAGPKLQRVKNAVPRKL